MEVIEDALSHADQRLTRKALTAQEWDLFAAGVPLEEITARAVEAEARANGLTEKEWAAVQLVDSGMSQRQAAAELGVSRRTLRTRLVRVQGRVDAPTLRLTPKERMHK